jgi:hypothetical protein
MYVLAAGITIDVNELPIEHLLVIVLFILVVLSIVFINGFAIKLGEKVRLRGNSTAFTSTLIPVDYIPLNEISYTVVYQYETLCSCRNSA